MVQVAHYGSTSTSVSNTPQAKGKQIYKPQTVCRLNIPQRKLHSLHKDPRFSGYCHTWISRPDFCAYGNDCFYIHMYPPGTVEEFGIAVVNIAADGKEISNPSMEIKGAKNTRQESKYSRFLIPGKKEFTPGCYRRPCGQLLAYGSCSFGDQCWFRHFQAMPITSYPCADHHVATRPTSYSERRILDWEQEVGGGWEARPAPKVTIDDRWKAVIAQSLRPCTTREGAVTSQRPSHQSPPETAAKKFDVIHVGTIVPTRKMATGCAFKHENKTWGNELIDF